MENKLDNLREKYSDQVREILNLLLESPYFYRGDNEYAFLFLKRYQQEFRDFFRENFDWDLIVDSKCARIYKNHWYNQQISPANRLQFRLNGRDECIAFMLLIEFFEKLLEEYSMTVEDAQNPRFKFGEFLEYTQKRFAELFPADGEKYDAEYIRRNILHGLIPQLVRYRFLAELPPPKGEDIGRDHYIYEALPALYHYNTGRLNETLEAPESGEAEENPVEPEEEWQDEPTEP